MCFQTVKLTLLCYMRRILIWILLVHVNIAIGQTSADKLYLKQKEDSLKKFAQKIVWGEDPVTRFKADSIFTRILVRALVTTNSFYYPFDSIIHISRLYAPDSAFRIFSWQVMRDENIVRRHGAIQIRTHDGSLKLYPLSDHAEMIKDPLNDSTSTKNWFGAIYYKILLNEFQGKKLYTLFGYDENNMYSTIKRLEILQFDDSGSPIFGMNRFFNFSEDSVKKPDQVRFWIEYKKDGNARLQYDEELEMILYDHLIPENGEADKQYTYIPDGDYEGFKWKNGKWIHVDKVFTFALQDGQAPVPVPIKEDKLTTPAQKSKRRKGN